MLVLLSATAIALVLIGVYLSWTAGRLDRLHNRVGAAWASLDAQLVRRAAVAGEIAHAATVRGLLPADACADLAATAQHALDAAAEERAAAENDLGRTLRSALDARGQETIGADIEMAPLLAALETAMTKVVLARRFLATAIEDTVALRKSRVVRWFRLAGTAPYPKYFDIDDTPVALTGSTVLGPH
ncbi:MAG: hypothetical protein ACJ735_14850 [Actinomycetes bacterium]